MSKSKFLGAIPLTKVRIFCLASYWCLHLVKFLNSSWTDSLFSHFLAKSKKIHFLCRTYFRVIKYHFFHGKIILFIILLQKARPYLFSNTLPPPVVASADTVFEKLIAGTDLPTKVLNNTELFRSRMTAAGFTVIGDGHPICPVSKSKSKKQYEKL